MNRTYDAGLINDILNDPAIRSTVALGREMDCTALITDRRNVFLADKRGGAVFAWRGPGIFEGHSFFRVRGKQAISLGMYALALMFENYGAQMIWGLTPEGLKHVRWFNRKLGFASHGLLETPEGRCELFVMEK